MVNPVDAFKLGPANAALFTFRQVRSQACIFARIDAFFVVEVFLVVAGGADAVAASEIIARVAIRREFVVCLIRAFAAKRNIQLVAGIRVPEHAFAALERVCKALSLERANPVRDESIKAFHLIARIVARAPRAAIAIAIGVAIFIPVASGVADLRRRRSRGESRRARGDAAARELLVAAAAGRRRPRRVPPGPVRQRGQGRRRRRRERRRRRGVVEAPAAPGPSSSGTRATTRTTRTPRRLRRRAFVEVHT